MRFPTHLMVFNRILHPDKLTHESTESRVRVSGIWTSLQTIFQLSFEETIDGLHAQLDADPTNETVFALAKLYQQEGALEELTELYLNQIEVSGSSTCTVSRTNLHRLRNTARAAIRATSRSAHRSYRCTEGTAHEPNRPP